MARKLRIEYPGAIYHVFNRGDRREEIFIDDKDREGFLAALEEVCDKTSWQIHAYRLMPNHFHLVVETPSPNLAEGMKWFLFLKEQAIPEAQLLGWRKGHWLKVELAEKLRAQTTVGLAWIANRRHMGPRGHLAFLLQSKHHPHNDENQQPSLGI